MNKNNDSLKQTITKYWTDRIGLPYTFIHIGNIKFKITRQTTISDDKLALFKCELNERLKKLLSSSNGYISLHQEDEIITSSLLKAGIELKEGHLKNSSVMYIEDDDVYVYEDGMKQAVKVL